MRVVFFRVLSLALCGVAALAQNPLTWEQVRERFRLNNPGLLAGQTGIEEFKAQEITAGLRPNPQLNVVLDQFRIFHPNPLQPFQNTQLTSSISQLFERHNKRGFRIESARQATAQARTDQEDFQRQMEFSLRDAFVRALQAKSVLELANENIAAYDKVIEVNRDRFKNGDIARVDLIRVELQRAQFESDRVNARVNLRTAKIALLALVNDRMPVDQFDLTGAFALRGQVLLHEEARKAALDQRPDLRSARIAVGKAQIDNKLAWANGSTDPVAGIEFQRSGPDNTLGLTLSIPLRIFDKNQGEKKRTALEITRLRRIRDAVTANIYRDVDSAWESVESAKALAQSYEGQYIAQSSDVRATVSFAYSKGGASLLDFLDAQRSYRDTQLAYRNLIASYLSAVNQLNLAVGREVIP